MTIKAFETKLQPIFPMNPNGEHGGFDPATKKLVPMFNLADIRGEQMFDTITAAAEAGVLDQTGWREQLFKTDEDFEEFLSTLADYDNFFYIHERWYRTFILLAEKNTEEEFVRGEDIAADLRGYVEENCK